MTKMLLAGLLGAGLLLAQKQPAMSKDMRDAIAFEHNKDVAAARQARKEAKHPSVTYDNANANRSADRSTDESQGKPVKDPGPDKSKKDK